MNRRELIRSAVMGAGAAATAGAQNHHVHVKTIAPAAAAATAAGEEWKPAVLDPHQNETVIALSELIIPATDTPGAKAAKVNEWIDLYLEDLAEDKGHSFLEGLGWLDGYALNKHGKPFVQLAEADQVKILETLDGASHDDPGLARGADYFNAVKPLADQDGPDLAPGAKFFTELKRLTVQGYYTSKIGIDELNKDGVPDTFACTHESHA